MTDALAKIKILVIMPTDTKVDWASILDTDTYEVTEIPMGTFKLLEIPYAALNKGYKHVFVAPGSAEEDLSSPGFFFAKNWLLGRFKVSTFQELVEFKHINRFLF